MDMIWPVREGNLGSDIYCGYSDPVENGCTCQAPFLPLALPWAPLTHNPQVCSTPFLYKQRVSAFGRPRSAERACSLIFKSIKFKRGHNALALAVHFNYNEIQKLKYLNRRTGFQLQIRLDHAVLIIVDQFCVLVLSRVRVFPRTYLHSSHGRGACLF